MMTTDAITATSGGRSRGGDGAVRLWGGLVGLVLLGSDDPEPRVPAPDRAGFAATVYPVLLRDCGFPACHGDARRPLFTPGPGRTRLAAEVALLDPATPAEVDRAYDRARALLLRDPAAPPPRRPTPPGPAPPRGGTAHGRNACEDPAAPGLQAPTAWAEGAAR